MIAVLFARKDSIYKNIPGCDVWDIERDARKWPGGAPIVAHPPCRGWGRLRAFAKPAPGELDLAPLAVQLVRQFGGVLEHPVGSALWELERLPVPGCFDVFGGWTLPLDQHWFGHLTKKATLLYIVGCRPRDIPRFPLRIDEPTHTIGASRRQSLAGGRLRPETSRAVREQTPPLFAAWLCEVARLCDRGGSACG